MPFSDISRRRMLQLSGGGLLAGSLGLNSSSVFAQEAPLKVWDQYSAEPILSAFQSVLDGFTAKTGHELNREVQLGASIKDIAATALSSGTGPDILQYSVGQGNAGLLADAGLLIPMEEYAAKYDWNNRLSSVSLLAASLGGKLWGAPQESEVSMLFVNRSLFEQHGWEVPTTHEEMIALSKEAKKAGVIALAYGEQDWYPSWWAFGHVASNAMGAKAVADMTFNNNGSFNTPEMIDGIEKFWVELQEAGGTIDQVTSLAAADAQALFLAGGALMFMSGTWAVGSIEQNMLGDAKLDVMPMWSFNGNPRAYPTGQGSALYISAACADPDQAADLINFMYEDEQAKLMVEKASIIAPTEIDIDGLDLSDFQKRNVEAVTTGDGNPEETQGAFPHHGLGGAAFTRLLTSGFQAISAGEKTPAQQAADLQEAWEQDLKA